MAALGHVFIDGKTFTLTPLPAGSVPVEVEWKERYLGLLNFFLVLSTPETCTLQWNHFAKCCQLQFKGKHNGSFTVRLTAELMQEYENWGKPKTSS